MSDYDYLDKGSTDGVLVGRDSSTKIAFFGITPTVQTSALGTTALTTISFTSASAISVTIPIMTTAGYGFINSAEGKSFVMVVRNIQARIALLESRLSEVGLIAGGTAVTSASATLHDYIGKGADDGSIIGQTTSKKVGFYGITPCDQPAASTTGLATIVITVSATGLTATVSAVISNSAGLGWTSQDEAFSTFSIVENLNTRIREVETNLVELGLVAGGTAITSASTYIYENLTKGQDDGTIVGYATANKLGFFGAEPVNQPDALTAAATTFNATAAGSPDYALQDPLSTIGTFKFASSEDAQTVLNAIYNAQVRMASIVSRVVELGIQASA